MRFRNYFLIVPKMELLERLKENAWTGNPALLEAILWSGVEHDRGDRRLFEGLLKVLFLDAVDRENASEAVFPHVFPNFSATEAFFDSSWSLQRIDLDTSVEESLDEVMESGREDSLIRQQREGSLAEYLSENLKWRAANPGPISDS